MKFLVCLERLIGSVHLARVCASGAFPLVVHCLISIYTGMAEEKGVVWDVVRPGVERGLCDVRACCREQSAGECWRSSSCMPGAALTGSG